MSEDADGSLVEARCRYIVSLVLIIHVKIVHRAALFSAAPPAPSSASWPPLPHIHIPCVSKCCALMGSLSTAGGEVMLQVAKNYFGCRLLWKWAELHPHCRGDSLTNPGTPSPVRVLKDRANSLYLSFEVRSTKRCRGQVTEEFRPPMPRKCWKGRAQGTGAGREGLTGPPPLWSVTGLSC